MKDGARSVGYCRVSTATQGEEGYSLEAQTRKIQAYADLHDLELIEIVVEVGSGKSVSSRPEFQRILEMVKTGNIDNVIILKLDRLARNVKEAVEIAELLQKKDVSLHSISERLDTGSASGRLFYNILSAMSQWEREVIAERTRTALAVKRDRGQRISRHAPYGYGFDADGNLVKVDTEQAVIVKIKELKADGHTVRGIVEYLAEHGYTNRKGNHFGVKETWTITKAAA